MKVTYTGRQIDLSPENAHKIELEFQKLGRLLDNGRGEAHAHVVLAHERVEHHHSHFAEVTVPYHHHELVGKAHNADLFTALHEAVGKLEAQALKVKEKWRDSRRVAEVGVADDRSVADASTASSGV